MSERLALGRRLPATLAALGALYTASAAIVWSGLAAREPAVAAGVTLDLTVTAAAIVWLGLVRARRWPAWTLVPVVGAGAVVARAAVPGAGALLEFLGTAWLAVEVALLVVRRASRPAPRPRPPGLAEPARGRRSIPRD